MCRTFEGNSSAKEAEDVCLQNRFGWGDSDFLFLDVDGYGKKEAPAILVKTAKPVKTSPPGFSVKDPKELALSLGS